MAEACSGANSPDHPPMSPVQIEVYRTGFGFLSHLTWHSQIFHTGHRLLTACSINPMLIAARERMAFSTGSAHLLVSVQIEIHQLHCPWMHSLFNKGQIGISLSSFYTVHRVLQILWHYSLGYYSLCGIAPKYPSLSVLLWFAPSEELRPDCFNSTIILCPVLLQPLVYHGLGQD